MSLVNGPPTANHFNAQSRTEHFNAQSLNRLSLLPVRCAAVTVSAFCPLNGSTNWFVTGQNADLGTSGGEGGRVLRTEHRYPK